MRDIRLPWRLGWHNLSNHLCSILGGNIEEQRYITMVQHVFVEWWRHQHGVERTKGVYLDDNLKMCETMSFGNIIFNNHYQGQ